MHFGFLKVLPMVTLIVLIGNVFLKVGEKIFEADPDTAPLWTYGASAIQWFSFRERSLGRLRRWRRCQRAFRLMPSFCASSVSVI